MTQLEVDFRLLGAAEQALQAAGRDLDALGARMPGGGDYGAAGALVELALGVQAEACARLGAEATMLGLAVGLVDADLGHTDAQQAVDLVTIGSAA